MIPLTNQVDSFVASALIAVGLLAVLHAGSAVEVVPESVMSQVGTGARLNCSTVHNEPVHWTTKPFGSMVTNDIYIGELLLLGDYGTSERFSVEVNSTQRRYDLVIHDIKQSDGGVYSCIDERGFGKKDRAELIVWDRLTCLAVQTHDNLMGENVFDADQDTISFYCNMNYWGNIRPQFVWSVGGKKLNGTQGAEFGIASSSLTLVATSKLDGANVTCEAVIRDSSSENTSTGVLWISDTIRVKYAVLKKEGVKECPGVVNTLKCNPPCSYKLETVNGTQRCAVSYSIGTDVKWFHFYDSRTHSSKTDTIYTTILTITTFFLVCSIVDSLAVRFMIRKRRDGKAEISGNGEDLPLADKRSEQHRPTADSQ